MAPGKVTIADAYLGHTTTLLLKPGQIYKNFWTFAASVGWYDFTIGIDTDQGFQRRLAGHIETGKISASDPRIGNA